MKIQFTDAPPADVGCDLLAVAVGSDVDADLRDLDARFGGRLLDWVRAREFEGKPGTTLEAPAFGAIAARELVLVGVGDRGGPALRKAAGKVGRVARTRRATRVALAFGPVDAEVLAWVGVGNYAYERCRPEEDRTPPLGELTVVGAPVDTGGVGPVVEAQAWARDLVNAPAADIYPESLADEARTLADLDGVEVEVWDRARLEAEGCVGILAVGQGSDRPPVMIRITYRPPGASEHVALVGKGVTFDAGGLSLKPTQAMQTMRCDMGGAATVLGVVRAAAALGLPVAIDAFIGAAENMVSGRSYKLGDVLRYRNGVHVEIHNTDAEGRLVLADCLIEASRVEGAGCVLDFATLTGACVVALGSDFSGLFTEDEALAEALLAAAEHTGEGLWRLPLHAPYKEMLKAEWGTIKNVGGREAGATTAALFLQHFVEDKRWAHLDIAGPAFLDKARGAYAAGGTGQMVRTVTRWLQGL